MTAENSALVAALIVATILAKIVDKAWDHMAARRGNGHADARERDLDARADAARVEEIRERATILANLTTLSNEVREMDRAFHAWRTTMQEKFARQAVLEERQEEIFRRLTEVERRMA